MSQRIQLGMLKVDPLLAEFVNAQLLPQLSLTQADFWTGFESIVDQFTSRNTSLLSERDKIQAQIDEWHTSHRDTPFDSIAYVQFLREIGYLVEEGDDFTICTENVDPEIATMAGPQLVVPVKNARFALNAANARWGSLFDAIYGSDVIAEVDGCERTQGYNPLRGHKVIAFAKGFLDQACPLINAIHDQAVAYRVISGQLLVETEQGVTTLADLDQLLGYRGEASAPESVLLVNNGLHIEILIDRDSEIGSTDPAGVKDITPKAALTTIQDCDDSVDGQGDVTQAEGLGASVFGVGGALEVFGWPEEPVEGDDNEVHDVGVERAVLCVLEVESLLKATQDGKVGWVGAAGRFVLVSQALEERSEYWIVLEGSKRVLLWIASTQVGDPLAHRLERVCDCITSDSVVGAIAQAEDREVAELVFAARDIREVRGVAVLLAEGCLTPEVGVICFACLAGVGMGGDLESSAEVSREASLVGR